MGRFYFGIVVGIFLSSQIHAGAMDFYIRKKIQEEERAFTGPSALDDQIVEGVFKQKIDPTNAADERTFDQRYFINKTYTHDENSPVFYYICGEGACSASELTGFTRDLAGQFKGTMVTLEHRYYGKSQPFPTLTAENLKYLSTDNALDDLANFEKYAQANLGLKGKWIAIGGSYAGSLSAFYRMKYPSLVVGSLSSSGPVQAKANFEDYDFTVDRVAGSTCADAIRRAAAKVEESLDDPDTKLQMKKLFASEEIKNDIDFLYVVADMAAMAIQYGDRDYFCSELASGDEVAGYARAGKALFARFGITPLQDSFQGAESLNPADYSVIGMRQWMYQSCTEYGYWQTAYHDSGHSTRSKKIDLDYHNQVCNRLFGLQTPVDTAKTNAHLYLNLLDAAKTSNIFFTDGATDPWAELSITKELGNNTNVMTESMTIVGAAHCDDLRSIAQSTPEVNLAQTRSKEFVTAWLH